jgi:hypothetical protein
LSLFREGWLDYPRTPYRASLQSLLRDLLEREEENGDSLVRNHPLYTDKK